MHDPNAGYLPARVMLPGLLGLFASWLLLAPSSPLQAAMFGMLLGALVWLRLISWRQLAPLTARRHHRPRVFEGDPIEVRLDFSRGHGQPLQLLCVEDHFTPSLAVQHYHLVPWLGQGWRVSVHDRHLVDRHRGIYLNGPLRVRACDPLGVFVDRRELAVFTRLTVYPHAGTLPDYRVPGETARPGPSLDVIARVGHGEEVLGVREYAPGDPPSRIHWRTSVRRRNWHVINLDRPVQAELAVMADMSRRARFGLGAEATSELVVRAATRLLTSAYHARHRFSLAYSQHEPVVFPAGAGLAHLHLLLDQLAVLTPAGESSLWHDLAPRALGLAPGDRVALIGPSATVPLEPGVRLVERLVALGLGVDCVLIDERDFMKIYRDQDADPRRPGPSFDQVREKLALAGARTFILRKTDAAKQLDQTPERGWTLVEG